MDRTRDEQPPAGTTGPVTLGGYDDTDWDAVGHFAEHAFPLVTSTAVGVPSRRSAHVMADMGGVPEPQRPEIVLPLG